MTTLSAFLQGILQGLTEFLPVSSSGHLSLYQYLTGISSESSAVFSVMLHLGTLLAVIIAFRKTVWRLIVEFFRMLGDLFTGRLFKKGQHPAPERRMLYFLMLSCVPLLFVLPLKNVISGISADNDIIAEGVCFLITAAILFLGDRAAHGHKKAASMTAKDSVLVGVAQAVATLPGISRSGSTISAGLLCGFDRSYAVSYSFILGLPAVLGAGLLDLKDVLGGEVAGISMGPALVGMLTAAVFGLLAIGLVRWLVKSDKFRIFAYYTLVIGVLTLGLGIYEAASGHAIQTLIAGLIR